MSTLSVQEEKKRLRAQLRAARRSLTATEVSSTSRQICEYVRAFRLFQQARTLVLYSADENEVQTEAIWQEALLHSKAVYYPRITADLKNLEFVRRYPGEHLKSGTFGILIPPGEHLLTDLQETDVVFTPGVGFDVQGRRLGRGKGYYDRAFRGVLCGAQRVALAHQCQVVPIIPVDHRDEVVSYIITEQGVIDCTTEAF